MILFIALAAPRGGAAAERAATTETTITPPVAPPTTAAAVWAIDDGERIGRDDPAPSWAAGTDNPVWRPGAPIALLALRDEVVAFQIVVAAGGAAADDVAVELAPLAGPGGDAIRVERFVEHFFEVKRPSSTGGHTYSLGWAAGSGPPPGRFIGWLPDALIPVEQAPAWARYPLRVGAGRNGAVWIDLTVPADQAAGVYRGQVVVRAGARTLARLPLELEVLDATLPVRPVATMLFYDRGALDRRVGGGDATERQLWRLFHQHRVAPLHGVGSAADVDDHLPALDGSLYTRARGYAGPAAGAGDGVVVLGPYGTLGDPSPARLALVESIADRLAAHRLFDRAQVVLYAEDEDCASPRGAGWRALLAGSTKAAAHQVRVGWTCGDDPSRQPVDLPMVDAGAYDPARAAAARAAGKEVWIYGGYRPASGTVFTDTEAVSLRTLGWIAAMTGIPRWFIWETTFWYDGNRGGHGAYDPFVSAETFHNRDGEAAMGDGVLVYPGRQLDGFTEHSLDIDGVIPSIRLKNLRRGVQDAGYYLLARAARPAEADRIARALLPRILAEAIPGAPPAWSERGAPFFAARRALARLIAPGADPGPPAGVGAAPPEGKGGAAGASPRRRRKRTWAALAVAGLVAVAALATALRAAARARRQASS
jgi:hypothetical protein